MNKLLVVLLMFVVSTAPLVGQSSISSVYGVRLGDSENSVVSSLNSQGIKGEWKTISKERFYRVESPTLGNCIFEACTFRFSDGKLSKVRFFSSNGAYADPNFEGANPYYPDRFNSDVDRFQRIFNTMKLDLLGKYGTPQLEDESRLIWRSANGNQLTIEYNYKDETMDSGWHDCFAGVYVTYEYNSRRSSNF